MPPPDRSQGQYGPYQNPAQSLTEILLNARADVGGGSAVGRAPASAGANPYPNQSIGRAPNGGQLTIPMGSGGSATRNPSSYVPSGYELVERRGNSIVVRPAAPTFDPSPPVQGPALPGREPYSPIAAALQETANRARQERATAARDDYARQAASHQYGNPNVVRVSNQFTELFTQQQREAAQTTFDALSLPDGIAGDATYNVGTTKESFSRYRTGAQGTKSMKDKAAADGQPVQNGRQEGQSDVYGDVQDLRVGGRNASQATRDVSVVNTITGGIAQFQQMSVTNPDVYNAMVYRLWSAGLINGSLSDAGLGGWTAGTGKALANAMAAVSQLNNQGMQITLDEYLDNLSNARQQALTEEQAASSGGGGTSSAPAPRSYTSREELNARLKSTAQEVLGRALSDDEADRFAAAFRGTENAAYDKAEADQDYENPNASASAQAYVEDNNQTEAAAYRIQGFMERLKTELGL